MLFEYLLADNAEDAETERAEPSTPKESLMGARPFSTGASMPLLDDDEEALPPGEYGDRYRATGLIGEGSMGIVHRVADLTLGRSVAMKVIRPQYAEDRTLLARFIEEARTIASLEHPGIVPVYQMGTLPDGRFFFTMREITGRTLADILAEVNSLPAEVRWDGESSDWTLRRLIDVFLKACEAVAYSHSQGVIHRDLKPANVVVGTYGEVLVVDWGLAKLVGRPDDLDPDAEEAWYDLRAPSSGTVPGSIMGTPAYMPPEQALAESEAHGPASDVWALGSTLHEILVGRPPYVGETAMDVLRQVQAGPPEPISEDQPHIPEPLREICHHAMAWEPEDRYPDASGLMRDISDWLERSRQRQIALEIVEAARKKRRDIARLTTRATALREEAALMAHSLGVTADITAKRSLWSLEDEVLRLEHGARILETRVIQLARSALEHEPALPEAHNFLAEHYRDRHARAEAVQDSVSAAQYAMLLKQHDFGRYTEYLGGHGRLTLYTEPAPALIEIHRYVERDRRLVPERFGSPYKAPLEAIELPMGSFLLRISGVSRLAVSYPVSVGREEEVRPSGTDGAYDVPVYLPSSDELDEGEVYIPAGWFWRGGDRLASDSVPRRRDWVDSFVIQRDPVTHAQYIEFLDDLVATGREDEALRYVPRGGANMGPFGRSIYVREPDGRFSLRRNSTPLDAPVTLVDILCVTMYILWLSVRTHRRWRLPEEIEWEKAARGVDGRFFPWGNRFDPTLCCNRESGTMTVPVTEFAYDVSPYGVRGMGGNVRDWCQPQEPPHEAMVEEEPAALRYMVRGGSCVDASNECRAAARSSMHPRHRSPFVGFRLVRSL